MDGQADELTIICILILGCKVRIQKVKKDNVPCALLPVKLCREVHRAAQG